MSLLTHLTYLFGIMRHLKFSPLRHSQMPHVLGRPTRIGNIDTPSAMSANDSENSKILRESSQTLQFFIAYLHVFGTARFLFPFCNLLRHFLAVQAIPFTSQFQTVLLLHFETFFSRYAFAIYSIRFCNVAAYVAACCAAEMLLAVIAMLILFAGDLVIRSCLSQKFLYEFQLMQPN